MRFATLLLTAAAAVFSFSSTTNAQVINLPNTGCADGAAVGPAVVGVGSPTIPTDGSVNPFGLSVPCGVGNAALFLWGLGADAAGAPGAFNWPLTDPCFASWVAPPASCNGNILQIILFDGALADAAGNVTFTLPLVDLRPAVDLSAFSITSPGFAIQFLCINSNVPPCESVSQAARFFLLYN